MSDTILPGYYTLDEAAKKLGYKSKSTLTAKCREGKIPSYKVANAVLIPEIWINEEVKKDPPAKGYTRGEAR